MEEVISSLEREFKRVYLDIEYVSHRLDIDTSRTRNDDIPDVCSFMKRLNELENRLLSINDRTERITNEREELFNEIVNVLNDNHKALSNITNSMSGFKVDDVHSFNEAKNDLSNTLNKSCVFFNASITENITINDKVENDENSVQNIIPTIKSCVNEKIIKKERLDMISKERFEAVPLSIRGRCKLEQISVVLQKLQSHHKLNKSSISLAELDSCGLTVTGKTGNEIISTLKSLGLITKSKDGISLVSKKSK